MPEDTWICDRAQMRRQGAVGQRIAAQLPGGSGQGLAVRDGRSGAHARHDGRAPTSAAQARRLPRRVCEGDGDAAHDQGGGRINPELSENAVRRAAAKGLGIQKAGRDRAWRWWRQLTVGCGDVFRGSDG